jgi:acid phosphatase
VTSDQSQPFTAFPSDYSQLPDVAFVAGNFDHDMHDGTVQQGDDWLKQNLDGYITWAKTHNSLLILTWDETAVVGSNHIPLLYVGAHLTPGSTYDPKVDHYTTLRTIEAAMGLTTLLGESAQRQPVTGVWS